MDELITLWDENLGLFGAILVCVAIVAVSLFFRKYAAPKALASDDSKSSESSDNLVRPIGKPDAKADSSIDAGVVSGVVGEQQPASGKSSTDISGPEEEIHLLLEEALQSGEGEQDLEAEIAGVEKQRLEDKTSYEAHIEDLEARIERLDKLSGELDETLVNDAKKALMNDDKAQAGELFRAVKERADAHIEAAAEADYQLGKLAGDEFRYQDAYKHFQRAAQLVPGNTFYLNEAGVMAFTLGQYVNAIKYYEQALAKDLKTHGEEHIDVATRRNNLGLAFDSLGQYKAAIEYFELALPTFKSVLGDDHPDTKTLLANLKLLKAEFSTGN